MIFSFVLTSFFSLAFAQQTKPELDTSKKPDVKEDNSAANISFNPDSNVISQHSTTIKGQRVSFQATAGTMPVWDEDGKAIAGLFYTYYERSDVKDRTSRPLVISFNGGPGSASVWMQIAYTGPKLLNIDDEGYPIQPYGIKENPYSILDVADIVFVNPVNTAYSRPMVNKDVAKEKFFGVNADIKYLASWINTFVTRNNRWASPKYLIGESYGTTRVSGLALELQNKQWMYLNGVVLVSPADYKVIRNDGPVSDALNIPYFTATAWHHKRLPDAIQKLDLKDVLAQSETFAIEEVIPALTRGGFLDTDKRKKIAEKMAYFTGLSAKDYLDNNLSVSTDYFWKHLMKDVSGHTVGRLDSRYLGIDKKLSGTEPDYSAELTSWLHSFTPSINHYFKEELKFETDLKYNMFGNVSPWNNENDNTRDNLRQAMAQNPYLNVMFQSGYYDGATTYFNAKYTMWQMDPSGVLKDRFSFKGYRSGHMMYLRKEDLKTSNDDLRAFILRTFKVGGVAKY